MSFFSDIKTLVQSIYPDATIRLLPQGRINSEAAKIDTENNLPFIVQDENFSDSNRKNNTSRLKSTSTYKLYFLDSDEWDNRANRDGTAQADEATDEIISRMQALADEVIYKFSNRPTSFVFGGAANERPEWTSNSYIRKNTSSMSGVEVEIKFTYYKQPCS